MSEEAAAKVMAYMALIEERVLNNVQKADIRNSCTLTLMLVFSAIDGIAKLFVQSDPHLVGERFKMFLVFMGGKYETNKDKIYKLRNSIIHEAMNFESYMSHASDTQPLHLSINDDSGYIFVNSNQFCIDFEAAFNRFKNSIENDTQLMMQASNRLKWKEAFAVDQNGEGPTPPPPIEFIVTSI